jgi:DNA repair protein RecO (recombination protein O)
MPNPRIYRTDAVVLRQRRLGDADKICVLFTPQRGRIEAVGKGLRRPKSKLAGHLEPLTKVSLILATGRTLDIITQAEAIETFPALHDNIDRLSRGLYVAELVDRFTDTASDVGELYRLLVGALQRLNESSGLDLIVRWFEMQLLLDQGVQPRLDTCVHCDSDLTPEGNAFAPLLGGVLCPGCRVGLPGRPLSAKAFKLLRFMQTAPYGDVARVRIDEALGREIEAHLREVVQSALDQEVRAAGFVEAVRATRPLPTESSP